MGEEKLIAVRDWMKSICTRGDVSGVGGDILIP